MPGAESEQAADFDVMRGEETQLLGAWQLMPAECYVMPGTHCKWVQVQNGVVRQFATAMTGELHHLLMPFAARQRAACAVAGRCGV